MSSLRSSSVCLRTRAGLPRPHLGTLKLQGEKQGQAKAHALARPYTELNLQAKAMQGRGVVGGLNCTSAASRCHKARHYGAMKTHTPRQRPGTHLDSQSGLLPDEMLDSEAQRRRGAAFLPGSCSLLEPPKPLVRPGNTDEQDRVSLRHSCPGSEPLQGAPNRGGSPLTPTAHSLPQPREHRSPHPITRTRRRKPAKGPPPQSRIPKS